MQTFRNDPIAAPIAMAPAGARQRRKKSGSSILLTLHQGFAKASEYTVDLLAPEFMKFLVSRMPGLKLQLLDKIVHARNSTQVVETLSPEEIESHQMTVCKAVEDRICKRIDLASRTDLTVQQAIDALRLLLKIVRRNDLPADFSFAEIFLLVHGVSWKSRGATTLPLAGVRF